MSPSETWFLLQQEGLLAESCLCNGLTSLRNANLGDKKGLFYSAFFGLSIGFERVMKVIVIIDHMANHRLSAPPTNTLRTMGHHLGRLFDEVRKIAATRGITSLQGFNPGSIQVRILDFLDHFADPEGRYANINKLTGHKKQIMPDPLYRWGLIASDIHKAASTGSRTHDRAERALRSAPVLSLIGDTDRRTLSVAQLLKRASEIETAARHAIAELIALIAALRDVLDDATTRADQVSTALFPNTLIVPDMKVCLGFAWPNRQYVMRKKRWP
jgi:hypothetical protein